MNPSADYQLGTLDSLPSPQNRDVLIILTCSRCQPVFEGQPDSDTGGGDSGPAFKRTLFRLPFFRPDNGLPPVL